MNLNTLRHQVMCYDYGYRSGVGRMYMSKDGTIPSSGITLAVGGEWLSLLQQMKRTRIN
jgi:hypothetical protein